MVKVMMIIWTGEEDGAHALEEMPALKKHPNLHPRVVLRYCGNGHMQ
jgi:hypothetical protein